MRNRFCLLLSAIAFLSITQSTQAQISVDGSTATQVNGNAIAPTGAGTINGNNLYHSFSEFNVPQSGVIFNTGNSAVNGADVRNIINRVTGDNPSAILGTLESRQAFPNANLYLMNPNGIIFGQNARLDIGGSFHATTGNGLGFDSGTFSVDKNSLSFPNGDPKTIRFAIAQPAGIINQGNLSVDTGKSITFTGGSIINTGTLTAPSGNIALTAVAGNSQVELRSPDVVLGLQVTNNAIPTNWSGKITELPKLAELLTGKVPEANQVVVKADGSLALVASPAANDITVTNGMSVISGRVDVSSSDSKAGNVGIFGEKVGLVSAQIDASGALGGGTVLIGGNLQGNGISPNALKTFVNSSSKIDVSAILRGNAGTVIVWADLNTRFLGSIIAKGGNQSGDGGFVEVSGKQNLDYRGNVNTLAPNGKTGTLLLDPTDINVVFSAPVGSFTGLTDVDEFSDPDTAQPGNFLTVGFINGATSNVILQATNDINFDTSVAITTLGVGLTAQAGRDINVNENIATNAGAINFTAGRDIVVNDNISTKAGAINFTAGRDIIGTGALKTSPTSGNAGNVDLTAGRDVSLNSIDAVSNITGNGGNVTIQAIGNIQTTGTFPAFGNTYSIATNPGGLVGNAGNISLTSTSGAIDVSSGRVHAVATIGNSGNITFQAAGNIITGAGVAPLAAVGSFIASGGNGIPGTISFTSLSGAIDTSLGTVDAGNSNIGNGGNVFFQAADNITTATISAETVDANGNGGRISLISQLGSIKSTAGLLSTTSFGNAGSIFLQALGNILTSDLAAGSNFLGNAGRISATSTNGVIDTTLGTVRARINGGNGLGGTVDFRAAGNVNTGEILATGNLGGGTINLTSNNGAINTITGNIDASSINGNGGNITFVARNSITTTNLNASSDLASGGNISLDPIGDIIFNSANTAGSIQGGNFFASSTGGNIRVTGFVSSVFAACGGSSICSASNSGGTGGQIFLRHGGLTPFVIGNSSTNGTTGIVTTGSSTLALSSIIPVGTGIFTQGNIIVAPSGNTIFTPPKKIVEVNPSPPETKILIQIRDIMKKEVDLFLKEENLDKAFESIEKAYISELGVFLGEPLKLPTLTINQAQDILSDVSKRSGSPSVLIYPIMLNDRIEVLVVPPKELGKPFHRYTNYANEEEIITVLTDYRASLRDTSSLDYLEQARKLYDWVMRPIDAQLQALKVETVVFVMDSGLRVIPPAALHDGKQFLVERYASANIPSLRVTRLEELDRKNTRVLAMGLTEAREGLSALPAVEVEIRTIANQVLSGTTFLDRDFTVNNLQAQRGKAKYGIIHLGTHGKFLQDRSNESFIQFWDGKLRSSQIPSLRFDQPVIDMLTLSACETAVGNNLGISGLAVESGARSILASLWTVSDAGTAPLMISFYKAFPDALSKATALRKAQLDLIKGKVKIVNNQIVGVEGLAAIALPKGTGNIDISHPFFWSSFILVGNWL
ncbi:MAG: CHAT domain-containing protein [Pseudanabaena sp. M158S2SP1A06QC]|nr:CHAT domain-containing protein [Pseudanabaena sp. M176S2SP2A07QC]MCA6537242.1 CHAT domain-containing protein [Pseudanabaena sp. M037S2SP2A07QC]MCA6548989.1 CHAT domain-containing protein [Pseudanabaena sp. M152S2SP2A07QC]MCA6553338.1 CHAT domain-containing protein [Pseudanabaena sp. M135S2SP2A07QC]MCA6564846.1 CHAT domain-containing protein [Pseudanabaena sp. M151S2SP2A07QC]MCA6571180.1 CHAT domain-containing protein [Pseudanabaena sp. M065S1SP2A07QC]MCA6579795.1 CHAT domain-containing pro